MSLNNRFVAQMIVLLPTIAMSALLGYAHVPPVPRLIASLGFGMLLIAGVAYAQRGRR